MKITKLNIPNLRYPKYPKLREEITQKYPDLQFHSKNPIKCKINPNFSRLISTEEFSVSVQARET